MRKLRPGQTNVILRLIAIADRPQNLEAMQYIVFQFDFQDYEQFIIEAPPGSIRFNNLIRVAAFYDSLGLLVEGGAVDANTVFEIFPVPWARVAPIIQGMRREQGWPDMFDHFETLARRYERWWEERRRKWKLDASVLPPPGARPKVVAIARPAPVARPGQPPLRPGAPGQPAAGVRPAAARQTAPVRPGAARPAAMPARYATAMSTSPAARAPARLARPPYPAAGTGSKKVSPARAKSASLVKLSSRRAKATFRR